MCRASIYCHLFRDVFLHLSLFVSESNKHMLESDAELEAFLPQYELYCELCCRLDVHALACLMDFITSKKQSVLDVITAVSNAKHWKCYHHLLQAPLNESLLVVWPFI